MTVREALPELEGQGFFELLDRVYATGEPFVGQSLPITIQRTPGAPPEARILDFVYQPITDADGEVSGIFVEGIDVTSAHDAAMRRCDESEESFRTLAEAMPNQGVGVARHGWRSGSGSTSRNYEYSGLSAADLDRSRPGSPSSTPKIGPRPSTRWNGVADCPATSTRWNSGCDGRTRPIAGTSARAVPDPRRGMA